MEKKQTWRQGYLNSLIKRKRARSIKQYALDNDKNYTDALDDVVAAGMTALRIRHKFFGKQISVTKKAGEVKI